MNIVDGPYCNAIYMHFSCNLMFIHNIHCLKKKKYDKPLVRSPVKLTTVQLFWNVLRYTLTLHYLISCFAKIVTEKCDVLVNNSL